jgi:type I restriction-modification system DNA methylase subunit
MSEELLQRDLINNPDKIGKWDFRNIGSTTLNALKNAGIIPKKDYKSFERRKPDGIITSKKEVIAIVENKDVSKFKTPKQKEDAFKQGLDVAQILNAKILILTDTIDTIWINALNGAEILDEKGNPLKTDFSAKNSDLPKLIEQIIDSIDKSNSQIKEPRLKDPTRLAKSVWQDLWMAAGATPENCLYSFVELFIFKYLSDLEILKGHLSYDFIMEMFEKETDNVVLKYYADNVRKHIKTQLFPITSADNTTIINGTIFVSKDDEAVDGFGSVFHKILTKFGDEKEGGGEFRNINKDFKSKLFETFLKESISKKNWGQYFTPLKVVRAIVRMAESDIKENITICDPACGVGKFLLEPLLINNNIEHFYKVEDGELIRKITLVGIDKGFDKEEQKTIILAKANMLIYMSEMIRKHSDITPEFSKLFNDTFELKTKNILGTLRDVNYEGKIDLILTNPPYVTTGSSNLKEEIIKSGLQSHYKINAMGVEGLFMEWIVRALKPGGKAFVVVPENLLFRDTDNNLREFILAQCYINGIVSLPKKTFFSTVQQTSILCITKKNSLQEKQNFPVFTYLVNEIGESRDANRFLMEQDDLTEAAEQFNGFQGSREYFIKNNKDKRCKIIPVDEFQHQSKWSILRFWNKHEKVELGIEEEVNFVDPEDYKLFIDETLNNIQRLRNEMDDIPKMPSDIRYTTKPLQEVFDFKSGNSKLTQSYINQNHGNFVVYSANTKNDGIFGYINSHDFDTECIQITTNGVYAGTVFYRDKHKFSINGDARLLIKKYENLDYLYLLKTLRDTFSEHNFNWENKPTASKTKDIAIKIPVDEQGKFSIKLQKELALIFTKTEYIQKSIAEEMEKLNKLNIIL